MTYLLAVVGVIFFTAGMQIGLFTKKNRERNVMIGAFLMLVGFVFLAIYIMQSNGNPF
ncbi:hypothetical protein [Oceanobacillus timonensis]|uniref:hypothetical protein n=1 Tax=Oceanobacillus timonensis TaxID=1926285 RepID=UPI0015C42110|nr:hypothetical protein [Oceanobacillus timonensis]